MSNESTLLIFHSTAQFKATYKHVSDGVFLYHAREQMLVAVNDSFGQMTGMVDKPWMPVPLAQLFPTSMQPIQAGQNLQTELKSVEGKAMPVFLHAAAALLAGEEHLLCVVQQPLAQQQLLAAEAEKKALLNEVYHRVKNNLNIIISLLGLQLNRAQQAEVRQALMESKSRIYALALLQERLYHSPRLSEIKADEYLASLAQSVISTFKETRQQLRFSPQVEECWLNVDVLVPLGLLLHELVANAVLHAFPDGGKGEIILLLQVQEDGLFKMVIQDSGLGLEEGSSYAGFKSLGSQLILSLSRQLKARHVLESAPGKGTKVTIEFTV